MAIQPSEIVRRLSGGASNSSAIASLGGVKSSVVMPDTLFDEVAAAESAAGRVEFRGVYVVNTSTTDTLKATVAWISTNTPSASTNLEIGLGTSALNGTEQTVANETTAPTGVTFSSAATKGAGISLGDIPPGGSRFVWLRRTVTAGAMSSADSAVLSVEGEA